MNGLEYNYIGLDVHTKIIVMAESRRAGEAEIAGEYPNTGSGVKKLLKKLDKLAKESEVKICYEAGPCGYALKRILDKHGFHCEIAAPSLIPKRSGDKIKTDKRDAIKLARLYRAGELTFITVPDKDQEAVRDLVRCREDMARDITKAKQRMHHFLIRHGFHYEKSNWTKGYREWARGLIFDNDNMKITRDYYLNTVELLEMQKQELDGMITEIAGKEPYKDKVRVLCAYRGIGELTAMIILSEIVDFKRFGNPKELMSYLGMVPSEYSSGGAISKGSITKCGNKRVRRALVETAWHYLKPPVITKSMKEHLENVPVSLRQAPVKALKRLHKRYYYLLFKGKSKQKAIVAVGRELIGFIWASMVSFDTEQRVSK